MLYIYIPFLQSKINFLSRAPFYPCSVFWRPSRTRTSAMAAGHEKEFYRLLMTGVPVGGNQEVITHLAQTSHLAVKMYALLYTVATENQDTGDFTWSSGRHSHTRNYKCYSTSAERLRYARGLLSVTNCSFYILNITIQAFPRVCHLKIHGTICWRATLQNFTTW